MSVEFEIRFWNRESSSAERFRQLVNCVQRRQGTIGYWKGASVRKMVPGQVVFEESGQMTADELCKRSTEWDDAAYHVTAYTAIEAWRFSGLIPRKGHLQVAVSTLGDQYGASLERNNETEGNCSLTILNSGPLNVLLREDEEAQNVNRHVEQNLNYVLDLVFDCIRSADMDMVQGYTDKGEPLLFNAHLAYFAHPDIALKALRQLILTLKEGAVGRNLPALEQTTIDSNAWFFHTWRSREMMEDLRNRLCQLLKLPEDSLTVDMIQKVLELGKLDYFSTDQNDSFLVLDYPHYLNSFIDTFVCDLVQ